MNCPVLYRHWWVGFTLLVAAWALPARAQQPAPAFTWAEAGLGPAANIPLATAVDAACNLYVAGAFEGQVTFGPATLTSQGDVDGYLAKYSAEGQLLWLRQVGGTGGEAAVGVSVDAAGNVAIIGNFGPARNAPNPRSPATISVGPFQLTSGNLVQEMFLAKYDAEGNVLWARQTVGTLAGSSSSGLAFDAAGDLYVCGTNYNRTRFEQVTLPTGGQYLAKYTAQGQLLWANAGYGPVNFFAPQLAVGATGPIYLVGYITHAFTLGMTTLSAPPNEARAYLARLDAEGAVQWVRPFTGKEGCQGLAVDPKGDVVLTTNFTETVTHGGQAFTSRGSDDVLTLKYSAQGDFAWGVQLGGSKPDTNGNSRWDRIKNPAVDALGNIYVAVELTGLRTLTTPSGTDDLFSYVVSYTPAGAMRWNRPTPTQNNSVAASGADQIYLAGGFIYGQDFDSFHLTSGSSFTDNTFVAKLGTGCGSRPPTATPLESFPNIITPNGDGLNDAFRLPGLPLGHWHLRVYSRWGNLVYEAPDYRQDWTALGLPDGTYFYLLQAPTQAAVKGWLEVLH